ncbi:glycosyltransferase family 39 protein [Neptunitalea lumnitzerae]|uniref:Glycosyltransferase RgtA/B/C/D-like domain-containing protein n=1 Tax=Neptunitalea lumnitzerae TaxID=2965509 RepID=A0ABQ5MJV7_9FLAO|nr:glycosyltransferase family 39 protein [Neptunitalea sp. Y10]GLB49674.1 hypothetical protein Y10_20420 [Neptunitalea sp. Y10]
MKKETIILLSTVLIKFILQFTLIAPEYELHRDEYLHLDQAHHLALGYASVPPITSITSLCIYLLGNSVFWVKFFPAMYGALTILFVWKTIKRLNGNLYALILGSCCILFSALLRLNTLYQPNSLDVLCWTGFFYFLISYIYTNKPKYIYFTAIIFAIGFLNKYNILFLVLGVTPALLATKARCIFTKREIYLAILLALILITPNLYWQYQNNFPVVTHMKVLSKTQLIHVNRLDFLLGQISFFTGSLLVILASLIALFLYAPFKKYKFLGLTFITILLIFTYFKAKDYYAIGLYPIYIAFGAVYLTNLLEKNKRNYISLLLIAIPVAIFFPMYTIAFPNQSADYIAKHSNIYKDYGLLRWEDGKDHEIPQDYADMLGWKELATKVADAYDKLPNSNATLILCDNYGQAGAINYYTNNRLKANTFEADYINWFQLNKPYKNFIRIKSQQNLDDEMQVTSPYFEKSYIADSITNKYAREHGTTIFVFEKASINISERLKEEIIDYKKQNN